MCLPEKLKFMHEPHGKLLVLALLFTAYAFVFTYVQVMPVHIWLVLTASALVWFAIELNANKSEPIRIYHALLIGLFLLVFDFIVENTGAILGYWHTQYSLHAFGAVPVEVMFICLIGGAAWALYLPRKMSRTFSLLDIIVFSFFGMLGEYILGKHGMMVYTAGWTSAHAFLGYLITWFILHIVRYMVVRDDIESGSARPGRGGSALGKG